MVLKNTFFQVCQTAEKFLRQHVSATNAKDEIKIKELIRQTLTSIGSKDIFNLGDHIRDTQDGIDNHSYLLLKSIVYEFFKLRQYQRAKINTQNLKSSGLRQKLTKTILFSGQ